MKKIYVTICFAALALVGFAQSNGKFGIEINLNNPFTNTDFFSTQGLSARYFISDDMVLRGTLNVSTNRSSTKGYNMSGDLLSTTKLANSWFGLAPGIEFHIAKFAKGSVYVGGELGVAFGSRSTSVVYDQSSYGINAKETTPLFGFDLGAFTGIDYYLTNNLYLGAEIGLSYGLRSSGRITETTGTTTGVIGDATSNSSIGIGVNPALRLGWRF